MSAPSRRSPMELDRNAVFACCIFMYVYAKYHTLYSCPHRHEGLGPGAMTNVVHLGLAHAHVASAAASSSLAWRLKMPP